MDCGQDWLEFCHDPVRIAVILYGQEPSQLTILQENFAQTPDCIMAQNMTLSASLGFATSPYHIAIVKRFTTSILASRSARQDAADHEYRLTIKRFTDFLLVRRSIWHGATDYNYRLAWWLYIESDTWGDLINNEATVVLILCAAVAFKIFRTFRKAVNYSPSPSRSLRPLLVHLVLWIVVVGYAVRIFPDLLSCAAWWVGWV